MKYKHFEPDEIEVIDNNNSYIAKNQIQDDEITVKLIYNEEEKREDILTKGLDNDKRFLLHILSK